MSEWKQQGSRVYGEGMSFNCTNIATAKDLYNTLNNYEKTIENIQSTSEQLYEIQKQLTHIQMKLTNLTKDITKIKEVLQDENISNRQ